MMAEKARYFVDDAALDAILAAAHPRDQKQIGREITGFDTEEWEHVESNGRPYCWNVVWKGNLAKFTQNSGVRRKLMATEGTTLVEASPVDSIWGIGLAEDDTRARDRSLWLGRNWLGEVLTDVREHLKESSY
jgi:ribA/ribD-fused uncharacterized protein